MKVLLLARDSAGHNSTRDNGTAHQLKYAVTTETARAAWPLCRVQVKRPSVAKNVDNAK